jgi:pyridoxamine 5'-phosphate oxidase
MTTTATYPRGDLRQVLEQVWGLLAHAAEDVTSPMNNPVLATVTPEGEPDARTVVLRRVDRERRRLYVNTDTRSPKHHELKPMPRAVFVFYDPQSRTQLRVRVDIRLHHDDETTRRAWDALPDDARRLYMTTSAPGDLAPVPTSGLPPAVEQHGPGRADEEAGYRHFAVLEAVVTHIDWLYFTESTPRRAAFSWEADDAPRAGWLYP